MLKNKISKAMLCVVTLLTILGVSTNVFATGVTPTITTGNTAAPMPTIQTLTNTNTNTAATTNTNTTNTNTSNSSVYSNTNTNTASSKSNLPKTGVDYSIVFIILACVVFAIFAYKKIKEYNSIKY